ncbi:N-acetylmuramoyl-L-alanine amidase [Sphingosinithalassobacter sp. CS137]|uniref:N-acetylmuramoyl-L-alanine amidase n=1 Tax=Sphingosinithalassobacter sp. CS137 TaxID=2762748 RepID=UPI00165E55B1|nr:N-acetylmuramoyl-L-alanine amidase [Sphingosinithalassobacter sp. CS137]
MYLGWTPHGPARHIARVLLFLAFLSGWLSGAPSWAQVIEDVRVQGDRVIVRFDAPAGQASAFLLGGPQRIALDVQGARPGGRSAAGGAVAGVRQGRHETGARVVLDLARPAIVTEGSFGSDGRTLTLELRTVDASRFARAAAEGRMQILPPFNYVQANSRSSYRETMRVPPPRPAAELPRVYGNDDTRPLVVIDAGHGGHDPGAISPDGAHQEKVLTLELAHAIKDALLASGRVRVAMTREDDRFLILQERYGIARRLGADLFISVHCDSAGNHDASGATAYTLSEVASDREAARLAARENRADIISGVDLRDQNPDISSILIDLTQRETMNISARFARLLGREAEPLIPTRTNFHRMASLVVLKAPDMPSVLFETGYISNAENARFLASEAGQERIAQSVRQAVEIHFATRLAAR